MPEISLQNLIGRGYKSFWNCKKRYRVVKGSRASKKSTTTALWYIINLMANPEANLLVVRRYERTLRDSCFAVLQWAIHRLGVHNFWRITVSPLEMTYIPSGNKILFRGLDDPLKITSITVKKGVLCWVWIEEAYQIENEENFNKLEMSIRGEVPKGLFKQFTLTFNPWAECWLKTRFFDNPDSDTLALTTTYECNEWLDESDIKQFEKMRINNPRRYRIEGAGSWGISEGLIYTNFEKRELHLKDFLNKHEYTAFYGLDFGFTDPTAFVGGFINFDTKEIFILMELYESGLTNQDIAQRLKDMGIRHEVIKCDSAEPKSIEELRKAGINAKPASKGADSVKFGIQKIQNYKIIFDVDCVNFEHEIKNYCWAKDRQGNATDVPDHEFSHCLTGDSLVMTVDGEKPIKELVGKNGYLYCYDGQGKSLTRFYDCRMTGKNAPIIEIELENGRSIKATPEHLIMTKNGWKEAGQLTEQDEILSV